MAETRLERDLRDLLAAQLDAVHGPYPRWADSPTARRVGRIQAPMRRPVFAVAAVLAAAVILGVAMAVVGLPWANQPVATSPATAAPTNEPLPSSVSPAASPTVGEVPMGRVAISTQGGVPALAVRVVQLPSPSGEAVIRIDLRVVGPMTQAVGISRFAVHHDGQTDPLPAASGPDLLAIPAGAGVGTTVYAEFTIAMRDDEWADLGYSGTPGYFSFTYALHRPGAVTLPATSSSCPTLADYAAASAQPTDTPQPTVSFAQADQPSQPTSGTIPLATVGAMAAADGTVGALVRVSNVRICDRLPDSRPDEFTSGPAWSFLLADVDLLVVQNGVLDGWISASSHVEAIYRGYNRLQTNRPPGWFPGANWRTSLQADAGFSYHGTVAWALPQGDGEITIGVFGRAGSESGDPQFQFAVRSGAVGREVLATPPSATSIPTLTPQLVPLPADSRAVLTEGSATVEAQVGRVAQVPRYPGIVPQVAGDVFLEFAYQQFASSGAYTWKPDEWVIVNPDGSVARRLFATADGSDPTSGYTTVEGGPDFVLPDRPFEMAPGLDMPFFQIAEVPAAGRVTLEYRPSGGPAVATWVLRGQ